MNSDAPGSKHDWMLTCRQMIRTLMVQFHWTLATEDELAIPLLARVPETCSAAALKQWIIHVYAGMLYDACRQSSDMKRRERAYTDLFRFLYRFAYKRFPEQAEDMVNQTLLTVYEHIEECREPGAFLSFAWWKLRAVMKKMQHREDTLLPLYDDQERAPAVPAEEGPEERILHAEQLQWTLDIIHHALNQREQEVIIMTYFGSYSDRDISQRLDLSLANVRVIRHRALHKLRREIDSNDENMDR